MKSCCRVKTGLCVSKLNPQPPENFSKDRKRPDGLTPHCKSCLKLFRDENKEQRNATIKKWRENNPGKLQKYRKDSAQKNCERMKQWRVKNRLVKLYNITNEDWAKMFEDQGGKCKICFTHAKDLKRGLCVDHDHMIGNVRGLLCHVCNKAIGLFKDDVSLMQRAISYVNA